MKKIVAILYATVLGMIFVHSESMSLEEGNDSSASKEESAETSNKENDSPSPQKKKKRKGKKKKKNKKSIKKSKNSDEEESTTSDEENSKKKKKIKGKKRKKMDEKNSKGKKKKRKGKMKKKKSSLTKEGDTKEGETEEEETEEEEKKDDSWKDQEYQAFNLHDDIEIIDPVIDSSQAIGDSIKIEALPITKLASIKKISLDKELLGKSIQFEISKMEISRDVDTKIEKLSEKAKESLNFHLESAIEMNKPPMKRGDNYKKDGKEGVRFRRELEKYRQIYAENLKKNNIDIYG
ncbi:MAG: hypothetical protein LBF44_03570 [Holosporaceae bacterium]|jgi:hypothetical protein|nr:hypothetical protein [Holosporaceae bacterium]